MSLLRAAEKTIRTYDVDDRCSVLVLNVLRKQLARSMSRSAHWIAHVVIFRMTFWHIPQDCPRPESSPFPMTISVCSDADHTFPSLFEAS